ncbi:GNAT family N-acetyltransferase [Yinghuangia soli]|uniref:GNAT family N-acetyltransferase n=1 Tax=Yinghuangia soli TaxID=2908204 RepID=A0AA41TWN8_9ACTN|nr:GNAT family N-acetyltransferase [Yinghuangia soli]MCF2526033.1 GNAT family N-acetyltransferase [Yinghuangia soli]
MRLRPFTPDDFDLMVELDSDPEVMRFLDDGKPTPPERVRDEVMPHVLHRYPVIAGLPGTWAAEDKATGEFLGWFELCPEDDDSVAEAELGYRLRRDTWGRGYATEGARALVERGFAAYGAERIVADTMTVNAGSRRVMEKAGLRYVRTFFEEWPVAIEGSEEGDVEYAVSREEWQGGRRA